MMKFPVIVCVLVVLSLDYSVSAGPPKCPIPVHYKEIGCTPITKDGEECPSSFNCDHLQLQNTTEGCLFKGQVYKDYNGPGELPPCVPYAQCVTPEGYFRAGHIDCGHSQHLPSFPGEPEVKCVTIRSGCCPQEVCGEEIAKLTVCHAEGDIHYGGEKWNPKEDKCIECTCDEHFDNSTSIYENNNCKVKECFQEFWHLNEFRSGCGPKFYGADRCCPSDTKCPSAKDKLIKAETPSKSDLKCKFGDLELALGDGVSDDNNCLDCRCLTPPLVECNWIEGCERIFN